MANEEKKVPVLNAKQIEEVNKYLGARLYQFGVRSYKLQYEETPRYTYKAVLKQEIPLKHLGLFGLGVSKCEFYVEVCHNVEDAKHTAFCVGQLHYEHVNGGSNGCEVGIAFYVTEDGRVTEDYKYRRL